MLSENSHEFCVYAMKKYLILLLCLLPSCVVGQINLTLKRELDSMYVLDQKYRAYLSDISKDKKLADSLMNAFEVTENLGGILWSYQSRIDSLNLVRVEKIIKTYGYPGSSLVGTPTNEVAWYVIQHSPKIEVYFPVIQQAGKASELPFSLIAMMQDRLLTQQNKPQIYGTQAMCYPLKDTTSNAQQCFIWPIENPDGVNERRKQAGFSSTVEENAEHLDVHYKVLTMREVRRIYNLGN